MNPIRKLIARRRADPDLAVEIEEHLQEKIGELMAEGKTRAEASAIAHREFGNVLKAEERSREVWQWPRLESFLADVRFALRMLRKNLGFAVVAVLTLALGIGANTTIFSFVYGILLQPLPYRDPGRLVILNETTPRVGKVSVSYPNFLDWRAQSRVFSQMAAVQQVAFDLGGVRQPERISGYAATPNFLSMMGVRPYIGRDFSAAEENAGTTPVVLLSYSLWQSHFGADPNVVGRTITLDGHTYAIVGVLPRNFRSPDKADVLEPMGVWATNNSEVTDRGERGDLTVIGRLAPGASLAQARTEMEGIAARLAKQYPESNDQFGVALEPIRETFVGDMRVPVLVLFAAVIFVLLIVCANVANLFLVRGAARTREMALRLAFGASPARIVRQMLTESLVLAIIGGALGVLVAIAGMRGILRLVPAGRLMGASVSLNGTVLLFATGVAVLAAFLFGLAPAWNSMKLDALAELKEGGRTATGGKEQNRLRATLVVAEISLALVLLVGAGLMTESLFRLLSVNPGFRPEHLLTMELDLRAERYAKAPEQLNFWQRVLEGVRALPGVESAGLGTAVPLMDDHGRTDITIEGMPLPRPGNFPHPDIHMVSPGYAETLGIPLLRGRTFLESDAQTAPRVALVNERLARQFFPNEDPIGKRFIFGHPSEKESPKWYTIVGVVSDTKLYGLANASRLEVYVSDLQDITDDMYLVVRSRVEPDALTPAIRVTVATIDKDQPITSIATMDKIVSNSVSGRRITLILLGVFSGLALALAAIGIYGVISYSVARRTHEIGIRVALGAGRGAVMKLVVGQGARLAIVGVGIGLVAALGLTRLMSSLLFGVSASDPLTFIGVAVLLAGVGLLACYIPARRAMRVDPMVALRYE